MKNRQKPGRLSALLAGQDGTVGIAIALLLPILFGFAGLAMDIGHMYMVNSQLKHAADAGALSGARSLVPYTGAPLTPNWAEALSKAPQTVQLNRADNYQLTDCQVDRGYWSFTTVPPSLLSAGIIPTADDYPAVKVTVTKTAGQNDGPVKRYLAPILNIIPGVLVKPTVDVSATSVAMISFPKGMKAGGLKPMVATKVIVDKYWDAFDPRNPGQPFQFKLGDGSQAEDTMWSTFQVIDNSNAYTKNLIENGNPNPLYIGDSIHLQPGVRAVDYGPNEMGLFINQTVVLPIVDPVTLVANTEAPVLGFIAFHITGYSQGGRYIEGFFDKNYVITNPQGATSPNLTTPSTSNPPQLVY
jgi:hypothetical protein